MRAFRVCVRTKDTIPPIVKAQRADRQTLPARKGWDSNHAMTSTVGAAPVSSDHMQDRGARMVPRLRRSGFSFGSKPSPYGLG